MKEYRNATIKKVTLGVEDHGFLTICVFLEGNGWCQMFGGISFGSWEKNSEGIPGLLAKHVMGICKAVGSTSWEGLEGMNCRVLADHGQIYTIGHWCKDVWFDPEEARRELTGDA